MAECGDHPGFVESGAVVRLPGILLRHLDVVLLVRPNGTDALGRFAHLLAGPAGLFLGAGARRPGMKLLLLDQFSDQGGAQQALLELLSGIRERGWSVM